MALGAATNNQLLIGQADGHVYAFNVLTGALSLVENLEIVGNQLSWVGGFGANRMVAWDDSATDTAVSYWASDSSPDNDGAVVETSAWDFDLPENVKLLEGFHVVSDIPAGVGASGEPATTVTVAYQLDESGGYTSLTTLDNTNTTTGDNWLPVSNVAGGSQTFRILRYKITTQGAMKVYSVTARARVADTQEVWDLYVLVENEFANGPRPSDETRAGGEIRTQLRDIAVSKRVVEFKDGYRDYRFGDESDPTGGYSTHPVIIDSIEDLIDNDGGGKLHITLKAAGSLDAVPTAGPGESV
jgi:hypothetical protein